MGLMGPHRGGGGSFPLPRWGLFLQICVTQNVLSTVLNPGAARYSKGSLFRTHKFRIPAWRFVNPKMK